MQNRGVGGPGDVFGLLLTATLPFCSEIRLESRMIQRGGNIPHVTGHFLGIESHPWTRDPTLDVALHLDQISTDNVQASPIENSPNRGQHHGQEGYLAGRLGMGLTPLGWQMRESPISLLVNNGIYQRRELTIR